MAPEAALRLRTPAPPWSDNGNRGRPHALLSVVGSFARSTAYPPRSQVLEKSRLGPLAAYRGPKRRHENEMSGWELSEAAIGGELTGDQPSATGPGPGSDQSTRRPRALC